MRQGGYVDDLPCGNQVGELSALRVVKRRRSDPLAESLLGELFEGPIQYAVTDAVQTQLVFERICRRLACEFG